MNTPRRTRRRVATGLAGLLLLVCVPLSSGCNKQMPGIALITGGSIFLTDVALTPVRSFLGTQTLNLINSFSSTTP